MRICILYNNEYEQIKAIIDIISNKYGLSELHLDTENIDEICNKIKINNFIASMHLSDYIKLKRYFKNTITFYIDCSEENIDDDSLYDEELFTFRILNNRILSTEQIANMIYEASYGKTLTDNKNRRIAMLQLKVEEDELLFAKTKNNAVIPSKRDEDGCYDIYCCFDENEIKIEPHEIKLIDSGIATAFDKKWRLAIRERGSNSKSGLITMSGQVDSGYRGSIFISLYNANTIPVIISKNITEIEKTNEYVKVPYSKAIAQFAIEEVPVLTKREVSYNFLKTLSSERGIGALGSSGK